MKKVVISFLFLFVCVICAQARPADSELQFKSCTPNVELTFPAASNAASDITPYYYSSSSSTFLDILTEIFVELWFLNNFMVNFDDYPYASEGKYLTFDTDMDTTFSGNAEAHWYRFALDNSCYCYPGLYAGTEFRFEGMIWKFFGPIFEIDLSNIVDLNNNDEDDEDSAITFQSPDFGIQLGIEMSIFQSNPLSLFWTIGWSRLQTGGNRYDGLFAQLIARSYPVRPVLREWRGTLISMSNSDKTKDFFLLESHLEVGVMVVGPLEVFAAWRYLSSESLEYRGSGFDVGARYHL
ncbi:MAG: hypothetical protein ILP07_02040 [Treponema sp.]|nr:hypothetical protein [Treponema sp.]